MHFILILAESNSPILSQIPSYFLHNWIISNFLRIRSLYLGFTWSCSSIRNPLGPKILCLWQSAIGSIAKIWRVDLMHSSSIGSIPCRALTPVAPKVKNVPDMKARQGPSQMLRGRSSKVLLILCHGWGDPGVTWTWNVKNYYFEWCITCKCRGLTRKSENFPRHEGGFWTSMTMTQKP